MKRCPSCNRLFSDGVSVCPQCNVSLSGNTNAGQPRIQVDKAEEVQNRQTVNQNQSIIGNQTNVYRSQVANQFDAGKMGFVEAVKTCFSKYACFSGRARRSEFWWFSLMNSLVGMVLYALCNASEFFSYVYNLWQLAVLLPGLAVCIRRLHDIGKSGKEYFWIFCPFYGIIRLLIDFTKDSEPGVNVYGPCPK